MVAPAQYSSEMHARRFGEFVDELLACEGPTGPCSRLKLHRDASTVARYLKNISRDFDLVSSLAKRSYRHANGFTKILLAASLDDKFHLRLHVWPTGIVHEQNVHDHRFSFWSCVLRGRIVNNIWKLAAVGQEFQHYRYWPRGDANFYRMEWIATQNLVQKCSSYAYGPGDIYDFDSSLLHTISSYDKPMTLLLEDRRDLAPYANVYTDRFFSPTVEISSPSISAREYLSHLDEAIGLLSDVELLSSRPQRPQ